MPERKRVSQKRLRWLADESSAWVQAGLISAGQKGAILSGYTVPDGEREAEQGSRLVAVMAILGAILLGVGAILFFASNWQAIPKWLKVCIILTAIISTYAAGYWLAFERRSYPKAGHALIFLGTLFYGSGIWLVAQIFHINAHFPNGVLFWALGIIPVAYVCRSLPVLTELSILLSVWTVMEQGPFGNTNLLYLPLLAVVMVLAYQMRSRLVVGLSLAGLVIWASFLVGVRVNQPQVIMLLAALMGLLIFSAGTIHVRQSKAAEMRTPYRFVGLLVFFLTSFLATFSLFYFRMGHRPAEGAFMYSALGLLCSAVVTSGFYTLTGKGNASDVKRYRAEGSLIILMVIVLAVMIFIRGSIAFLITANLFLFFAIIGVIVIGYLNKEALVINLGLVFFVLDVIARYFDFFWDMLDKSAFFMAGGLLLLAGGFFLEKKRRKIIHEMSVTL